jgi:hypothetical protein
MKTKIVICGSAKNHMFVAALDHDFERARDCLFNDVLETEDINEIVGKLMER